MLKKTLIIGIGSGGANIINDLIKRNNIYADYCFIDNDINTKNNSFANYKVYIEQNNDAKRNAERILFDFRKIQYNLETLMKQYDKIYVISCLGGMFASNVTPQVVKSVLNITQEYKIILITPFKTFTDNVLNRSENCLNKIKKLNADVHILSNEALRVINNKSMTFSEFYKIYNDEIEKIILQNNYRLDIFTQDFFDKYLSLK